MIRLVIFLVAILGITAGLHWLADRPGTVALDWQGYAVETSVFRGLILLTAFVGACMLAWSLGRRLWKSPATLGQLVMKRRERRGLDAISSGMIAIGTGDRAQATRAAVQARKSLPNEPLTHLLRAQAAQLQGDSATARRIYEGMLSAPDTEQLGLRGLFLEASREGETEAARQFAERALGLNPKLEWPALSLFDMQCKTRDWDGALGTLAEARRHGHIDKKLADRRRAVLLTALAQTLEDDHAEDALAKAQEAHGLAPDLVPAAAIAGRVLAARGQTPKASKTLLRAWKASPHPELAAAYAHARLGDSVVDRFNRARQLAQATPGHPEGAIALATAAIDARDWDAAKSALAPLIEKEPTQRVCTLMARVEGEGFNNAGRVREWLARAVHAPRDPSWIADGKVMESWQPVSPVSGAIDRCEWRVPDAGQTDEERALLSSRVAELIKLGAGPVVSLPQPIEPHSMETRRRPDAATVEVMPPRGDGRPTAPVDAWLHEEPSAGTRSVANGRGGPSSQQPIARKSAASAADDNPYIAQHAPDDPGPKQIEGGANATTQLERYRLVGAKN